MNKKHGFQISGARWRKSTYSEPHGHCVELAPLRDGEFVVRDSKNPEGPVLRAVDTEWAAFLRTVSDGRVR